MKEAVAIVAGLIALVYLIWFAPKGKGRRH